MIGSAKEKLETEKDTENVGVCRSHQAFVMLQSSHLFYSKPARHSDEI